MVKIRLTRVGAKNKPAYRIVAMDSREPRDGKHLEILGFYDPKTDPATIQLKEERILYWLSQGAQPTDTVLSILKKYGVWDKFLAMKTSAKSSA
ncbi:30S ribosomal protein S16 [Dictyoglomus thermophilum]|uniref:Small ribosomal subunit protein bS16 n=2 Tax=Dictyoglomus thermophilum TaxID=14 RepID=RS16_DICT6|nr:30S ribosomal protein S16 [Dictyoglomus thermophilum]B5YFD8.1 RecName: Full=Small ribosomal subunit protein bS16; AltName: Full=30S ribosomal protein S16 [Dictyoglomus thermophilum H-6-12]ACI18346.1 ribosomal protein S16 [Dictyoglomus thermophilum H-6-12]MCX7719837.1 30S ribosomal protein S16 [Dictyoglomus thermophilum]TYT22710.1 30S ribosomal protein S16 [Dictyoglomus thermophilum]